MGMVAPMVISRGILVSLVSFFLQGVCSAQIIQNGSFEQGLEGWTASEGISVDSQPDLPAQDGMYCATLGGGDISGASLSQPFSVQGGSHYVVSFDLAINGDVGRTGVLKVEISTPEAGTIAATTYSGAATNEGPHSFARKSLAFQVPATSSSATLTFRDESPEGGVAVDPWVARVEVTQTSLPPILVYRQTQFCQKSGCGKCWEERTNAFVVWDLAAQQMTSICFGKEAGMKRYRVVPEVDYTLCTAQGARGRSYTVLSKAATGTNDNGQPVSLSHFLKGSNATLRTGGERRVSFPATFSGVIRDIEVSPEDGSPVIVSGTVEMVLDWTWTWASNKANEASDEAVNRVVRHLEARGYSASGTGGNSNPGRAVNRSWAQPFPQPLPAP